MRRARGLLLAVALLAAGCGGTGGSITVGAAVPSVEPSAPRVSEALQVGPGAFRVRLSRRGYSLRVGVAPNRATVPNRITLSLERAGLAVGHARVDVAVGMVSMDMGTARYSLAGASSYAARAPAWLMPGRWRLTFTVRPPGGAPLRLELIDRLRP